MSQSELVPGVRIEGDQLVMPNGVRVPNTESTRRELTFRSQSGLGLTGWGSPVEVQAGGSFDDGSLGIDAVDDEDEEVKLLDPLVAYGQEATRYRLAGPRRRVTADDLDRMRGNP